MTLLGVAIAGGLGAVARYHVQGWIASVQRYPFPLSTLVVNALGSFLLGLITSAGRGAILAEPLSWVGVGFLGAFTTFSTFTYETLRLLEDRAWFYASLNVIGSVLLCVAAAALGWLVAGA